VKVIGHGVSLCSLEILRRGLWAEERSEEPGLWVRGLQNGGLCPPFNKLQRRLNSLLRCVVHLFIASCPNGDNQHLNFFAVDAIDDAGVACSDSAAAS